MNENDEVVGLARIVDANGLFGADDVVAVAAAAAGAADDGVFDAVPAPNFLHKGDKKF